MTTCHPAEEGHTGGGVPRLGGDRCHHLQKQWPQRLFFPERIAFGEIISIELPQGRRFSSTWRGISVLRKCGCDNRALGLPAVARHRAARSAFAKAAADSLREKGQRRLVSLNFASWNPICEWLRRLDALRWWPERAASFVPACVFILIWTPFPDLWGMDANVLGFAQRAHRADSRCAPSRHPRRCGSHQQH